MAVYAHEKYLIKCSNSKEHWKLIQGRSDTPFWYINQQILSPRKINRTWYC